MPTAIALRSDFSGGQLCRLARRSKDAAQARRLLALAAIYDGGSRSEAALLGDVTLQSYASTSIFGAVCPQEGKGAALVLPFCNTAAMNLHLAEISAMVSPDRHAVLLLDQAGWHLSGEVALPDNIILLPLPAKCPELNVMENVWPFMRDNWLSNRIFRDHDDIVAHCCYHWNRLVAQPRRIMSPGLRNWIRGF